MGDALAGYSKQDKRILARFACGWCDQPLHKKGCGAIYERCGEAVQQTRRDECLALHRKTTPTGRVHEGGNHGAA